MLTASSCLVHQAPDAAALAHDLARFVVQHLSDGLAQRGQALLVLSGGSTPVPFFEALSHADIDWSRVHITLADERCVAPDHVDSNERLVRAHLLQGPAAAAHWVSLQTADPEAALGSLPWPADVVVLGMGGDGHTASLFPHTPELSAALSDAPAGRCQVVSAPPLPNVPVPRISLNWRALLDTRQLVVHATGAAKWALLQKAVQPGPVEDLPIRLALHQQQVPCSVFDACGDFFSIERVLLVSREIAVIARGHV